MNTLKRLCGAFAASLLASSCATTPPITVNYYLPQGAMELTVIRTVVCDEANYPIIATNVVAKMSYSRDPDAARQLALRSLDSAFANTQVDFVLTDDGRLTSLNSTQTGQGFEIIKSAVALTTAAMGFDGSSPSFPVECAFIKAVAKDKPVTLTFRYLDDFRTTADDPLFHPTFSRIDPVPDSAFYYSRLAPMLGRVCFRTTLAERQPGVRAAAPEGDADMVYLGLREPGLASVEVSEGASSCGQTPFWKADVPVPQIGTPFNLPIPRAAVFGKQSVVLALGDSGAITTLKIGKDSGASAALNAATEVVNRVVVTDSEEAARLKAEADVIAQQQRLLRCYTTATCS